jgi:hypothetical protein
LADLDLDLVRDLDLDLFFERFFDEEVTGDLEYERDLDLDLEIGVLERDFV